jgi:PadR family transcriptional regulator
MKHTPATESVLRVFLAHPDEEHYGWELMEHTGLLSGTLYPILDRLSRKGWLESHWDTSQKPRKQYRITVRGIHDASEYLSLETSFRGQGSTNVDVAAILVSEVRSRDDDGRE